MVKPLARLLAFFTLSLLLAMGGVGLWLKQDVRVLNWAKPWLMRTLNPAGAPYKISFGEVAIDWRHLSRFGRIKLNHMVVTLLDGTAFAAMPKVEISIDPLGFLPRRHALHSIIMLAPKLYLSRSTEGAIRMGLNEEGQSLPLAELIGFFAGESDASKTTQLPFRAFAVENASLTLKDETGGNVLSSPHFNLSLAKHGGDMAGSLAMPFVYNKKSGRVDAQLSNSLTGNKQLLTLSLFKFPAELVCQFNACTPDVSGSGLVSGKASIAMNDAHALTGGAMALRMEAVTLIAPKFFPEPIKIKEGSVIGNLTDDGKNLLIEHTKLMLEDTTVTLRLQFLTLGEKWRLIMNGKASRLDVRKIYKYWPQVLAPATREWITSKLKSGYAASGTASLNITSKMYDANKFPTSAVQATVDARDITAEYVAGFPELKHANGIVRFVGDTLRVDATSGSVLSGAKITSATLTADDLHHPRAPMVAKINLSAPAADVATLLALEHFVFDDDWHLDPTKLKGKAAVSLKLGFDSFSEENTEGSGINFDNVTYDITTTLKNVSQPGLLGRINVRDLSGTLHTSNTALQFDGKLGLSATTGLDIALKQDEQGHIAADVSGSIPRSEFSTLGIPDKKQLGEGTLGLNAHIDLGKGSMRVARAEFDLGDMAMDIPEISWSKKRGEKGTLTLSPREEKNNFSLALNARDLLIENASLKLDDANNLVMLTLPRVVSAANDFALDYATRADGFSVNLKGKKLDASTSYGQSDNGLLAEFPPITLNVDLAELVLIRDMPLRNVKGNLTCDQARCASANLTALAGKGTLRATIAKLKGKRELVLTASDAGELLKALDITDRLYDGKLELRGKYDDTKQPAPFNGRLVISNFSLKNSQILGRVLSIASITGVGDALTGSMSFDKLGADIGHLAGIVNLRNGRASGASIGITMEGKVDTTTTNLNIKGVLVPANLINSLLPKIPLIGVLAGKEGEGLIAFNYKVDGKYSDPQVSVNPLSGLTPGVLRGVFGGGSDSSKNQAAPAAYPGDRPSAPAPVKKKSKAAPKKVSP